MPRFRFRLQPVLDHRDRIEREKQRLLAVVQQELFAANARLTDLRNDYERTGEELRVKHARLDAMELYNYYAHLDFVLRAVRAAEHRIAVLSVDVERAKLALLVARKNKKILETLKQRRRDAFDLEQDALEQRAIDDLNARRHGRRSTGLGGSL